MSCCPAISKREDTRRVDCGTMHRSFDGRPVAERMNFCPTNTPAAVDVIQQPVLEPAAANNVVEEGQ